MSRTKMVSRFPLLFACILMLGAVLISGCANKSATTTAPPSGGTSPAPGTPPSATVAATTPSAMPSATPVAPAAAIGGAPGQAQEPLPSQKPISLTSAATGIKTIKVKNWDGTATEFLQFKYKDSSGSVLNVQLPPKYKKEMRSKAGWRSLFLVFAVQEPPRNAMPLGKTAGTSATGAPGSSPTDTGAGGGAPSGLIQ
jgi:hypothetical protein